MMNSSEQIAASPGIYTLITELSRSREIKVGALGVFLFPSGFYAYIGSARGPGGLQARLGRHLRPADEKSMHWHIDYLLQEGKILSVCWTDSNAHTECEWAERIARAGNIFPPRFGASDCSCPGHLVLLSSDGIQEILSRFQEPGWEMEYIHPDSGPKLITPASH